MTSISKTKPDAKNETWLWKNKKALHQVTQGLKDSAESRTKSRGSFVKFIDKKE